VSSVCVNPLSRSWKAGEKFFVEFFFRICSFSQRNAFAELEQNGIFVIIAQMKSVAFGEKRDFLRQFAVAS
jgi:hypothetical protein